jgi:hypothetical protein
MSVERTEGQQERQALRRQLRQAGWNAGAGERGTGRSIRVPLWPAPHTGPTEGIEPHWAEGSTKMEALRNAVRELSGQSSTAEPSSSSTERQDDDAT